LAIESCSAVRVSAICRTSASAATKAGEPNAGGGGGRNCALLTRRYGLAWPSVANAGGDVASQQPSHVGTVPVNGAK
jgi:hypothetical protein